MAAYQVKRQIRNRVVPKVAMRYERMMRRAAARLPLPAFAGQIPPAVATFVGSYYRQTDAEMNDATEGRFTLFGRTVDFESIEGIDWSYRLADEDDIHLWPLKLAHLEVLHSLIASCDPSRHKSAIAITNSFAESRSFRARDAFAIAWSPYSASHRLLAILSGLSLAVQGGGIAADVRADLERFARLDAGFLWQNIEHELRNNHTERNLAALCLYHLAAESISPRRAKILDREVSQIIGDTILADGMQVERSAMYQGLTAMSLTIFAACPFLSRSTRLLAEDRASAVIRAWLFLTHSDGEIALFNDSWHGEVPAPRSIIDAEAYPPPAALSDAGYFRLNSGHVDVLFDAGEIGPHCSPAHGHADFLAVEIDVRGVRFVVDPGTSQYSTGEQRAFERSSASHNGPRFRGVEPVEYFGSFKVGRLNHAVPLPAELLSRLTVRAIGGQVETEAGLLRRIVCAAPSGGVIIVDRWHDDRHPGETTLLVPDAWHLSRSSGSVVRADCSELQTDVEVYQGSVASLEKACWSRRMMHLEPAHTIVLEPERIDGIQQLVYGIGVVSDVEVASIRDSLAASVDALSP